MPNKNFTDKISNKNLDFKLVQKPYSSVEAYMREHTEIFKELLEFYEDNYSKGDALRVLNKAEREFGHITAVATTSEKISHTKANSMHAYIRDILPHLYIEKTFKFTYDENKPLRIHGHELIDELQDKFQIGDQYSLSASDIKYKGRDAKHLPKHLDIRDALNDSLWGPALDIGQKIMDNFVASKNKVL